MDIMDGNKLKHAPYIIPLAISSLLLLLVIGCSGGSGVLPDPTQSINPDAKSGSGFWGFYQVLIDAQTKQADVIPLRNTDLALNVLGFLEPPVNSAVKIDPSSVTFNIAKKTVGLDVIIANPMDSPSNRFNGFDVKGIVFGPKVTNADGLTPFMNPADFSEVPLGYIDGLLGTPGSIAGYDGLWGYKYFCDGIGPDEILSAFFSKSGNLIHRGVFVEASVNKRHYSLSWDGTAYGFLVFNYAVYANYAPPSGDAPFTLNDYSITTANAREAFCASVDEVSNTLSYYQGTDAGTLNLDIEIWDWQGLKSSEVTVESIDGSLNVTPFDTTSAGNTPISTVFSWTDLDPVLTTAVDLEMLITVTDVKTFGASWFQGLLPADHPLYNTRIYNCFSHTVHVADHPPAGPPDPVTDLTLSTGRTGASAQKPLVTGVKISWADPGDSDIKEYGIYVDYDPYDGLTDNLVLLGTATALLFTHSQSSLVPLEKNAAYCYTVRSRSVATGGVASPGTEAANSQLAFIELEDFSGGTDAGGGTWTSQSTDGVTKWGLLTTGDYLINGETFGRNTPFLIGSNTSGASNDWITLVSPRIPDIPDVNNAFMEMNHNQDGTGGIFSSWTSVAMGTYSEIPDNGTGSHTLADFDWANGLGYGYVYNWPQAWDSSPSTGPGWALVFQEDEPCLESLGNNEWAFAWDGEHGVDKGPYFSGYSWYSGSCGGGVSGYASGRRYVGVAVGRYWNNTPNDAGAMVFDDIAAIID